MYLQFIKLFLTFIILSFGGYLLEVFVCSISLKKLVNRGFLFGPLCPIYGIGGLIIILTLSKYYESPFVIFTIGMVITSAIEYYTSYLFEKIFHNKWWDYQDRKDNINGRICLGNSIGFGIGSCAIIYYIEPFIDGLISIFKDKTIIIVGSIILVFFIADIIASVSIAYNLRHRLIIAEELKATKIKMLPSLIEKKYNEEISKLKFARNRLIKVFPVIYNKNKKELDLILNIKKKQLKVKKKSK